MISTEEENFLRIVYLYYRVVTPSLKRFFDGKHPNLSADLSANYTKLRQLSNPPPGQKRVLYQQQIVTLYPPTGTPPVASADIDLTLMVCLLRNLPPVVITPPTGFDKLPPKHDLSDGANIARIKYYKNYLVSHSTSGKIVVSVFNDIWTDLEMAIKGIGNAQDVADANFAKTKIMDSSMTTLLSTQHKLDAKVSGLEDQLTREQCNKTEIITHMSSTVQKMQDESKGKMNQINMKIEILEKDQTEFKNLQVVLSKEFEKLDQLVNESKTKADDIQSQVEITCSGIQKNISINKERISALEVNLQDVHYSETKKDWMISKLQQWKKDEDYFVETTACNHVLTCLLSNKCVSVVGPPGIGKTFLVQHVALEMEHIGFNVISVNTPNEIKQNYQLNKKLLFVVDDMCGNCTANTARLDEWKKGMKDITDILDKDSCKLILTCREQVFRDEGFKHSDMNILQTCKCNLLDDTLTLTHSEKEKIAKRYFNRNYTYQFESLFVYDFFPLLCKFYFNKTYSIQSILKDPFHYYRKELNNLFHDCKEGKYKIGALLFLTICNNYVEKKYLTGRDKRVNSILEDICFECGINDQLTGRFLMKELDALTGTFVSDEKEFYHTIHDKLFDFLAYYFGTKNEVTNTEFIRLLIKHADYDFIRQRFVIDEPEEPDYTINDLNLINITDDNILLYIERVFSQLTTSCDIVKFLSDHGERNYKPFKNALSTFLNQLPNDTLSNVIENASTNCVCLMFVMNLTEINSSFHKSLTWCCTEQYGVALKHDHIQKYIERMFDDMTKSDDVVGYMARCRCCRNEEFRTELHHYISKLSSITVTDLIRNASTSFVTQMFVTKEEDIHQSSDSIHKRYGIVITGDHIQFYSERFLNELKHSDAVPYYINWYRCSRNTDFNAAIQSCLANLSSEKINDLIKNASYSFIQNMFVFTIEDTKTISRHVHRHYGIEIPCDFIQVYIQRVFDDLTSSKDVNEYLQCNRNRTNATFQTRLLDYMSQLGEQKIQHLINIASQNFIDRLCVMSRDDINKLCVLEYKRYGVITPGGIMSRDKINKWCVLEYKRYGVIIPGDIIQVYIERVFDDITCSNQVDSRIRCNRNKGNKIFRKRLQNYMKQLSEPKIKHLFKIASPNFIDRLCMMPRDDIDFCRVREYKRYGFIIPGEFIQVYIQRVFEGITYSIDVDQRIQCNRNKRNTIFQTRLQDYMRQLSEPNIKHLIKTASQDFIDRLCVMSIDDIKDNCVYEYERYGVIIPEECISLYIARWLDGMTTLDIIDKYVERNRNRKTTIFKTSLHTFMDHLQEDEIEKLIQTGSADFLHKWFVTDDVKDNDLQDYEQHGIILKDRNLQKYNERVLTLMKYNRMYYNYKVPRNVMTYVNELQISRMTELIKEANPNVFHQIMTVDINKKSALEKFYSDSEKFIRCPESLIDQYIDRMIFDWGKREIHHVINNINLKNQSFVDKFLCHFNSLEPFKISELLQTKDYNKKNALALCCKLGKVNLAKWCLENYLHGVSKTKQNQLCALLLLVVFNGRLEENVLLDKLTKINEVILAFSEMHATPECATLCDVKAQLDFSLKEIIVKTEGAYYVKCKRVFNFFVFYFASIQNMSQILVDYADEILLYDKFLVVPLTYKQHDFILQLSDEQLQTCIERIFKCLSKSEKNIKYVLNRRNKVNLKSLTAYYRKLNAKEINSITENACIDFLNKMCIIVTSDTKYHMVEDSELYFVIPGNSILIYIKRIFDLVVKSDCVAACLQDNRNAKNEILRAKLSLYLSEINKEDIKNLINQASSDFISRMFIISTVDIKEKSFWEYERYGIFVPEEFLQMYIKRVFSDMTQSVNVPVNRNSENKTFQVAFHVYTNSLSEDVLTSLIRTASSKFISRLYLYKEENITDIRSRRFVFSFVSVPKKCSRILKQTLENHVISSHYCGSFTSQTFEIKNDSTSFKCTIFKKKDCNDVLIRIRRKNEQIIANFYEHLIKYVDPLFISKTIECCVRSTKGFLQKYIQRMKADWIEGHIYDVFGNINFGNLSFQCEFLNDLCNTDNAMQTKLANTKDSYTSDSPLAVSCSEGFSQLVEWCLDQNININSFNIYHEHPLDIAYTQNRSDIVLKLLNQKNRAYIDAHICFNILNEACKKGESSEIVVQLLKEKIDINCNNYSNHYITPLFTACQYGCEKIVSNLLECKADEIDINKGKRVKHSGINETPLYIACKRGHEQIVSLLLSHVADDVDVNKCTYDMETPLYAACEGGYNDIVSLLLAHEPNGINIRRLNGATSLFVSCLKGHDGVVSTLLNQQGIEKDMCTLTGMSPLFIASVLDHTQIAEMLLSRSADVDICIKNKDIVSQEFMIHRKNFEFHLPKIYLQPLCIEEFIKSIFKLICDNASERVKSYIDETEDDWVAHWIFGSSPLHLGSLMGHIKIVTLLGDRTSSINCFTENGSTPLFLACELGHEDIVRVLLDKNANPTLERKDGKTPLSIARENGHLKIADIISQTVKDNLYHSESIPE